MNGGSFADIKDGGKEAIMRDYEGKGWRKGERYRGRRVVHRRQKEVTGGEEHLCVFQNLNVDRGK